MIRPILYLTAFFISALLNAQEIDVFSDFSLDLPAKLSKVRQEFQINETLSADYFLTRSPHRPELSKIVVFNRFFDQQVISTLPKDKLILFVWEPVKLDPEFYNLYSKVYT